MNAIIRQGKAEDLPAVYDLVVELSIYEKEPDAVTATLEDYKHDFAENVFDILVAEVDGEVVGMALYYLSYSTWKGRMIYLEDFIVREAQRGKGIGKELFEAFLEDARQKEARLIKWQVLHWNDPAINFYRKYDAILEKEWWNGKLFLVEGIQ
jgi:GNAT superfamily N-acetyltransferase